MTKCSICAREVPESDVCSTLACRACHVSISFEACLAGTKRAFEEYEARIKAEGLDRMTPSGLQ